VGDSVFSRIRGMAVSAMIMHGRDTRATPVVTKCGLTGKDAALVSAIYRRRFLPCRILFRKCNLLKLYAFLGITATAASQDDILAGRLKC